jgi:YD repeat-containing protein
MSVTIGGITFDRVRYDREGDVLYLHVGDPATAVDFDASPEGHALRYDAAGRLVGVTLVNARWLLEHEGRITVTLPAPPAPPPLEADSAALAPALGLAG